MTKSPRERLMSLREKIDQQRNTIETLHKDGHQCPDAERQLRQMLTQIERTDAPERRAE